MSYASEEEEEYIEFTDFRYVIVDWTKFGKEWLDHYEDMDVYDGLKYGEVDHRFIVSAYPGSRCNHSMDLCASFAHGLPINRPQDVERLSMGDPLVRAEFGSVFVIMENRFVSGGRKDTSEFLRVHQEHI